MKHPTPYIVKPLTSWGQVLCPLYSVSLLGIIRTLGMELPSLLLRDTSFQTSRSCTSGGGTPRTTTVKEEREELMWGSRLTRRAVTVSCGSQQRRLFWSA